MVACNGVLLNHESPRRGETFVTRKITRGLALMDARLPVVSNTVTPTVFDKLLSDAQEAKARNARLTGVAPECADAELFNTLLRCPRWTGY